MSRTNYERDRIRKASQFEAEMNQRIQALRGELLREVRAYLAERIKADREGRVALTVGNVTAANNIGGVISRVIRDRGRKFIRWVIMKLTDLFRVNTNYFRSFLEYPKSRDERALRLLLLRIGYDTNTNRVVPGGFLSRVFQMEGVAASIARDIQQSLAARMSLSAFRAAFSKRFRAAGYVERWFRQFTRDLFHQYDASAQKVLADELELDYFQYAGTEIRTTRCFCERRINRIYTRTFAEQWNNDQWRGKIPNGNFFIDRGGYNCRHHLSFITEKRATRVANQRGIQINSFNETGCNERTE